MDYTLAIYRQDARIAFSIEQTGQEDGRARATRVVLSLRSTPNSLSGSSSTRARQRPQEETGQLRQARLPRQRRISRDERRASSTGRGQSSPGTKRFHWVDTPTRCHVTLLRRRSQPSRRFGTENGAGAETLDYVALFVSGARVHRLCHRAAGIVAVIADPGSVSRARSKPGPAPPQQYQ